MRVSDRLKSYFVMLFFLVMGISGVTGAFLSVIEPSYHRMPLFIGIIVFSICFTALYDQERSRRKNMLIVGISIFYVAYWIWRWDDIKSGLVSIAESVIQIANPYYKVNLIIVDGIAGGIEETTLAILVIIFGLTGLLGYGIVCRFSKCITGLLLLLPFISGFLLGKVPDFLWLLCMILCYAGVAAGSAKSEGSPQWIQKKSALVMTIAAGAAVLAAAFLVSPIIERQYPAIQKANVKMREYVNREVWPRLTRFDEWFAGSGVQQTVSGDLENADGFSYTGARALTVTVADRPEETVYLKGFTASQYTGKAWEASSEDELQQFAEAYGWNSTDRVNLDVWNLEFAAAQVIAGYRESGDVQDMQINRIAAPSQYTYYPYGAYLNEEIPMYGDGALHGIGASSWSFAFLPRESFYPSSYPGNPLEESGWSGLEQQYERYVYSNYLDYPAEQLPRLVQQCSESGMAGAGVQAISDYIVQTLADTAVYSLNPGRCPDDEEFTEYFLFERKEGFCVHFATTATLMFRMLGIPARYVTGYVAPQNTFKTDSEGGYTAVVEDQKAHAWTEIYISRLGWIPVEATPGYSAAAPSSTEPPETAQPPEQEPQSIEEAVQTEEPTPTPDSDSRGDNVKDSGSQVQGSGTVRKVLLIFGKIIIGLLAAAAAILLWRGLQIGRRRRDFTVGNGSDNVRKIFQYLYQALLFAGFSEEIDVTSEIFPEKLCSRYTELDLGESRVFMDLVMRASYSAEKLEKEDGQKARKFYRKACRAIYRKLPRYKRFIFRMIRGFY